MSLEEMIARMKSHPRISEAGMILYHNGIGRATTKEGKKVSGMTLKIPPDVLPGIIAEIKSRPGIVEVLAELNEGKLNIGDDIMIVAVAGDTREHVFPALQDLIQHIKQRITEQEE